jgi:hypothetical protein
MLSLSGDVLRSLYNYKHDSYANGLTHERESLEIEVTAAAEATVAARNSSSRKWPYRSTSDSFATTMTTRVLVVFEGQSVHDIIIVRRAAMSAFFYTTHNASTYPKSSYCLVSRRVVGKWS